MILDLIEKRQSVRAYLPDPVSREAIEKCLNAARLAPSACNSQPWHFIIIDDPALKDELCAKIFSGPFAMNGFAKAAPVIVAIVSEKASFVTKLESFFRGTAYYLMDIGIAAEHFALQAAELGLGTCLIGWFNEQEAKKILKVPKEKKLDCVIALGYPAQPQRLKNRKPLEKISSFNGYQSH